MRPLRFALLTSATLITVPSAWSADQIQMTVGGRLRDFVFAADQDDAPGEDLNPVGLMADNRFYLDGRTVLDNGISIRASIQFYALSREKADVDEAFFEVITSFGRLRMGEKEGQNADLIFDPVPAALLITDEEIIGDALEARTGVTARNALTFRRFVDDALGVSYQSPEIAGIAVALSYHPTTKEGFVGSVDKAVEECNAFDASARYEGDFSGGTYRLAGGYFKSQSANTVRNGNKAWNLSLALTYGGWEAGGTYMNSTPANGLDEKGWGVGGLYSIGPIRVSADYFKGKRKPTPTAVRREDVKKLTLQASYRIGPEITLGLAGFYGDQTNALGANYDGIGMLTGLRVGF